MSTFRSLSSGEGVGEGVRGEGVKGEGEGGGCLVSGESESVRVEGGGCVVGFLRLCVDCSCRGSFSWLFSLL